MRWQGSDAPPFPLEAIRDRYVSPFAGVSYDLAPFEIGLSAEALNANTSLAVDARVVVGLGAPNPAPRGGPVLTRATYRVVPLDTHRPDALRLSPHGEVVFSTFEQEEESSLVPWLRRGDPIVLNAALARFAAHPRRTGEPI